MEEAENLRRRGKAGHYGITAEEEEGIRRRKRAFTKTTLSSLKSQLKEARRRERTAREDAGVPASAMT